MSETVRREWNDFKSFAFKGNAFDLAVGVIVGAAFSRIVDGIVNLLIMPIIGAVTGGLNFDNYFLPDRNPVRIRVLRREKVSVPAGTFDAIVIQPIIKTKGIFSEGGKAEVWLSDDDRHIILQMKSRVPHLPVGSLNLFLKSYRPPTKTP